LQTAQLQCSLTDHTFCLREAWLELPNSFLTTRVLFGALSIQTWTLHYCEHQESLQRTTRNRSMIYYFYISFVRELLPSTTAAAPAIAGAKAEGSCTSKALTTGNDHTRLRLQ